MKGKCSGGEIQPSPLRPLRVSLQTVSGHPARERRPLRWHAGDPRDLRSHRCQLPEQPAWCDAQLVAGAEHSITQSGRQGRCEQRVAAR